MITALAVAGGDITFFDDQAQLGGDNILNVVPELGCEALGGGCSD